VKPKAEKTDTAFVPIGVKELINLYLKTTQAIIPLTTRALRGLIDDVQARKMWEDCPEER
jgi:hypothetical protein